MDITRRQALRNIGLLALGASVGCHKHKPSAFVAAYENVNLRQRWLDSIERPSYVANVQYIDFSIVSSEYGKKGFTSTAGTLALTGKPGEKPMGAGAKSIVLVYPLLFEKNVQDLDGLEIYVRSAIVDHEFTHANHNYAGIPGIPLEHFSPKGTFDDSLFHVVSEVFAYKNQFEKLLDHSDNGYVHESLVFCTQANQYFIRETLAKTTDQTILSAIKNASLVG